MVEHPGIFNMAASMSRLASGHLLPLLNVTKFSSHLVRQTLIQIPKVQPISRTCLSTFSRKQLPIFGRSSLSNRHPLMLQIRQIITKGKKKQFTGQNKKDGIPDGYMLVYTAEITNSMKYCNIGVHILIIASIFAAGWKMYDYYQETKTFDPFEDGMLAFYFIGPIVGMMFLLTMRGLALRTFLRIYFNEMTDTFRAVCISGNCVTNKIIKFTPQEVLQRDISGYMKHFYGNMLIHGRAYSVDSKDFRSPHYYNHMMQWEKPRNEDIDDSIDNIFGPRKSKSES